MLRAAQEIMDGLSAVGSGDGEEGQEASLGAVSTEIGAPAS